MIEKGFVCHACPFLEILLIFLCNRNVVPVGSLWSRVAVCVVEVAARRQRQGGTVRGASLTRGSSWRGRGRV